MPLPGLWREYLVGKRLIGRSTDRDKRAIHRLMTDIAALGQIIELLHELRAVFSFDSRRYRVNGSSERSDIRDGNAGVKHRGFDKTLLELAEFVGSECPVPGIACRPEFEMLDLDRGHDASELRDVLLGLACDEW